VPQPKWGPIRSRSRLTATKFTRFCPRAIERQSMKPFAPEGQAIKPEGHEKTSARAEKLCFGGNRKNAHIDPQHDNPEFGSKTMHHQVQADRTSLETSERFRRPMDVVEATGIPIVEKFSILRAWEADERALQRAEDEGMGGGEHAHLQRVQEALGRLRALGAG
jgi:hypothetical protein